MSLMQGSPLPNITTTQDQVTSAPSWYTDYLSGLSKNVTAGTTGAQYADAQPLQTAAFNKAATTTNTYPGYFDTAMQATYNVGNNDITQAATPGGKSRIEQFMNPYTTKVVDALGELGQRNIQQFLAPQATASAVGTGQFGSKRGAEILGQAINTGLTNTQNAQSQALQAGYTEALRAAQADQQSKLGAAAQYGSLASAGQAANLADINALATMGQQQQTINQNKELFPLQAANLGAQALRGYNIPTSVSNKYTGPIPGAYAASPLQQIASLGAIIGGISKTPFGDAAGSALSKFFTGNSSTPNMGTIDPNQMPFDYDWTKDFNLSNSTYSGGGDDEPVQP
ncbi:MAG: hypothetical protein WCG15_01340 [Actinomycetes bacterium]